MPDNVRRADTLHAKLHSVKTVVIGIDEAGQRLDNFLLAQFKNIPKSHIYRMIRKGEVRVNSKRISPFFKLEYQDRVRLPPLYFEEKKKPILDYAAKKVASYILYENNHFMVVNKPSGIPVHGGSGISWGIIEAFRSLYPTYKLELVHRLDKETSGCLLIAKNRKTLVQLHALLRENKLKKTYIALLKGNLRKKQYISMPLFKHVLSSGERFVRTDRMGKPAFTLFVPLKHFAETTLVQVIPETGRTHQIRVHAQSMHHPIAGDSKYGDKVFNAHLKKQGLKRLFLHASSITFSLPGDNKPHTFEAPLPEELIQNG